MRTKTDKFIINIAVFSFLMAAGHFFLVRQDGLASLEFSFYSTLFYGVLFGFWSKIGRK